MRELEGLDRGHPLRERLRGLQMLALYRWDRQADALEVYQDPRGGLCGAWDRAEAPDFRELEHAILRQDASLELGVARTAHRSAAHLLVAPSRDEALGAVLSVATALAAGRELVVARIVAEERELRRRHRGPRARCGTPARTAAFTSDDPAADLVRLATTNDADLVLVDAPAGIDARAAARTLAALLERAPAQVAILAGGPVRLTRTRFTCRSAAASTTGPRSSSARGSRPRRDRRCGSSARARIRAAAAATPAVCSPMRRSPVQRLVEVDATPVLAEPGPAALLEAVADGAVVAVGVSPRWRAEGIGAARRALVRDARPPVLLVHRGLRPAASRRTRAAPASPGRSVLLELVAGRLVAARRTPRSRA